MIGIAKTIGRLIAVLVDAGIIEAKKAVWILEPLKDKKEFTEALEQEPKTGHWIVHPKGVYARLVCDRCLTSAPYDCKTNYCPSCGAKMVEPQESEGTK